MKQIAHTNKEAPYDRFYSKLTHMSVWTYTNILLLGKFEDRAILSFVDAEPSSHALDYGCNTGRHARLVKQEYDCSVYGADINAAAVSAAQENGIPAEIISPTFFEKYASFFDVIILSHVLQQVDSPGDVLSGIHGLLKKGGSLVIVVPQERIRGDTNPVQTLYFLFRLKFENPHKRKFSKEQLFSLLRNTGFAPEQHVFANFVPPYLTKDRIFLTSRSLIVRCSKNEAGHP